MQMEISLLGSKLTLADPSQASYILLHGVVGGGGAMLNYPGLP